MMKAVAYFSCTGQSRRVAQWMATRLGWELCDIETVSTRTFERLVLVFPVHCQAPPALVTAFLKELTCRELVLIATYGRMWHGNVLYELQRRFEHKVVAAAYVPTKHSYLEGKEFEDFETLSDIVGKLTAAQATAVVLPRLFRNPLAPVSPRVRSQLGVTLTKTDACTQCGVCTAACPIGAMTNGVANRDCIRCLRCVTVCPQQAIRFRLRLPMRWYLQKKPREDVRVYV